MDISFGRWLKQRRIFYELTQDDLAQLVSCSSETIRKIEAGTRRPSRDIAQLLAKHLGIAPGEQQAFIAFARGESVTYLSHQQAPTGAPSTASGRRLSLPTTNVFLPLTPLLGRKHELATLRQQIVQGASRLLTVTGTAGIGKTRLALEVAAQVTTHFMDGVFLVTLDTVIDPSLVPAVIMRTLGLMESGDEPRTRLLAHLHDKHMLLVLDNFEQVVGAAPFVAELLTACPWLQLVVTSRTLLHVRGERQFILSPLAIPDPDQPISLEQVTQYGSVALFVTRAQAVNVDWMPTDATLRTIVDLCAHLDGLPLAIELAAAHSRLFSPKQILHQFKGHYALEARGYSDLPDRQHTLRQAIEWSYNLLGGPAQRLFARLAVFQGGWTLETATAVCGQQDDALSAFNASASVHILPDLLTLVDHNLVRREVIHDGESRFTMLNTIRQYAYEQLDACGELAAMQERHMYYFLAFAEQTEPLLYGREQRIGLRALEQEQANLQTALAWCRSTPANTLAGLRLAGALGEFWLIRSYLSQGHTWLKELLESDQGAATPARAKALRYAGVLASAQGAVDQALMWDREGLEIYRTLDDAWGVAYTLAALGSVQFWHNHNMEQGYSLLQESLTLARAVGDPWLLARVAWQVGTFAYYSGRAEEQGYSLLEESLTLARSIHNFWDISNVLPQLANIMRTRGDTAHISALLDEALALARSIGNVRGIAFALNIMGMIALDQGDYVQAKMCHQEGLAIAQRANLSHLRSVAVYCLGRVARCEGMYHEAHMWFSQSLKDYHTVNANQDIVDCLVSLADIANAMQQAERATRLLRAATTILEQAGLYLVGIYEVEYQEILSNTRNQLDPGVWTRAWAEGAAMPLDDMIAYACRLYPVGFYPPNKEYRVVEVQVGQRGTVMNSFS
jgi:predicted ATPase/transcriptional regulator with XRE-family HTH domain